MQTPKSKLKGLADMYKLVVDSIEAFSKSKDGPGAEDSIPILVYIYSKAELNFIASTLK